MSFWPRSWKPRLPPEADLPLLRAVIDMTTWLRSIRGEKDEYRRKRLFGLLARTFMAGYAAGMREESVTQAAALRKILER